MKTLKENDIIVEIIQDNIMTSIDVYRIISYEYVPEQEIDYGTHKEIERSGWKIDAQFKHFNKREIVENNNCLIECRQFNQEETNPDLIRELRSRWIFERDKPVYFLRRRKDNLEFFEKIQKTEELFSEMEIL